MKATSKFLQIPLIFLLCLIIDDTTAQVRHPGPRITCPICIAQDIRGLMPEARQRKLPRSEIIEIAKKTSPQADPTAIARILDNWARVDLSNIKIDKDLSFQTYIVEFGDGTNKKFYTLKSTANSWSLASNDVNVILEKALEGNAGRESVYLLIDDMYSAKAERFFNNVDLFQARKETDKIKSIGCDVSLTSTGMPIRLGSTILEPGASIGTISKITASGDNGFAANVNFLVGSRQVKLNVFARTANAVKSFIATLKSYFSATPGTSIAKAVNRSRILSGVDIKTKYTEAGMTQFVEIKSQKEIVEEGASKSLAVSISGFRADNVFDRNN